MIMVVAIRSIMETEVRRNTYRAYLEWCKEAKAMLGEE